LIIKRGEGTDHRSLSTEHYIPRDNDRAYLHPGDYAGVVGGGWWELMPISGAEGTVSCHSCKCPVTGIMMLLKHVKEWQTDKRKQQTKVKIKKD
jgi:hypothetical protein